MTASVLPPVNGGSAWTLLTTNTPSAASSTTFSSIDTSTYDYFKIVFEDLDASTASNLRMTIGGETTGFFSMCAAMCQTGASAATVDTDSSTSSGTYWYLSTAAASRQFEANLRGELIIWNLGAAESTLMEGKLTYESASGYLNIAHIWGGHWKPTAYDSIDITPSTGTITGTVKLYGAMFL